MSRDGWQVEAAERKGRPLPEWYQDEPQLWPGDEFYLRAFYELSTCRGVGMSAGPIPWNIAVMYAQYQGLDADSIQPFIDIIRKLDAVYLDDAAAEMEKAARQNG